MLTAENSPEPVVTKVVRPGEVAEVLPGGDSAVEAGVVLQDLADALRRDRGGSADRPRRVTTLPWGVDPGVLLLDGLEQRCVTVSVFRPWVTGVVPWLIARLEHTEIQRVP